MDELLQVLIVDDESSAIKSLKYSLDWEKYGFEITAEAYDGKEALDLLQIETFALVITDIRMPEMDGLQLVEKIREFSDIPIIILSGYDEFDYARQGMRWGVKDYLLKPVDSQVLIGMLEQVKKEIMDKRLQEKKFYHGQTMMKDHLLKEWAHGYLEDPKLIEELCAVGTIQNQLYRVLLIDPKEIDPSSNYGTDPKLKLQRFAIRNVLEEVAAPKGFLFSESDMRFGMVIIGVEGDIAEASINQKAEEMIEAVNQFTKHSIVISAGPAVTSFHDVVYSYLTALKQLEADTNKAKHSIMVMNDLKWKQENQSSQVVNAIKDRVQSQYHLNLNMRLIANQIFMNSAYLGQLFISQTGMTFNEYLLQTRMEQAKKLLITTDKKVYEIAGEVGYKELDWFYKKFKEYAGKSASEYRGGEIG